jgi:pimeloyl-ACP methyl ester carboxylesterase
MISRIESFLSARLHIYPQVVAERITFISNLSGRLSLYAMYYGGSVPEPLLPPDISLQNPELIGGRSSMVFPRLGKIMVMIDHDGDEVYQPMLIPADGGFPEPAFGEALKEYRVHFMDGDPDRGFVYLNAESLTRPMQAAFRGDLATGEVEKLAESPYGALPVAHSPDHTRVIYVDSYTVGDTLVYGMERGKRVVYYGKPLEERRAGEEVPLNGIQAVEFCPSAESLLVLSAVFDDHYSLGTLDFKAPGKLSPVALSGAVHTGLGEMTGLVHLKGSRYAISYNIDGCSWLYEGVFNETRRQMSLRNVLVGEGDLSEGVLEHMDYDRAGDRFALSFSTAVLPTQIYTIEGKERETIVMHTEERILGVPESALSRGEDASYTSFDGGRVSARLYLPSAELGFQGARPLVYYVHGGPQGQERPDFAWFSMPLIQFLTLKGFAVFVPNVRGSTGYGLDYTKQVDRDWGGADRLDHVHAMTKILPKDKRLDLHRAAVVGRSYGGYMTLTLAGRHPELWSAACDMFGPYDLVTFSERIPPTWKPYYRIALADPETADGRAFLNERSPRTYLHQLACPLLVIQGRNDPRVVARESEDLIADLQKQGKEVQLMVFEDEGHDVLKYANRVKCYNAIADFFDRALNRA